MVTQKKLECVIIERKENIATVILNNPEKRNNLSPGLTRDLASAYEELRDDDAIDVVITTGAGVSWCAGLPAEFLSGRDGRSSGPEPKSTPPGEMVAGGGYSEILRTYPKATIAAVNGYCVGAATPFLASHDLAMASEEKAQFSMPEVIRSVALGGWPPIVVRSMPTKWFFDMALTGDSIDARTAQMIGLVTRVVPHDKLMERAFEWAKEIGRWDRMTVDYIKMQIRIAQEEINYHKATDMCFALSRELSRRNPRRGTGAAQFLDKGKGPWGQPAKAMAKWIHKE